jgi:hypothetical protein
MRPFSSASAIMLYPILEGRTKFTYNTEWKKNPINTNNFKAALGIEYGLGDHN